MSQWSYQQRMNLLREKKIRHTLEKRSQMGYTDADDYGTIPAPADYAFTPVTDDRGAIFGSKLCAENFSRLVDAHPVYVDPLEILCGRWCRMLTAYREVFGTWDEEKYPYDDLKPLQEKYGIVSGIGSDTHCAPDFAMGLELGFGGFIEKIEKYRALNPGREEFYDAEKTCVEAMQRTILRHIDEIKRQLIDEERPEIQRTLKMMLDANEHILHNPPANFLEACQWIGWYSVFTRIYDRDGAGCQLDALLLPYYKKDIEEGRIDDDLARFILANLLLVETHYYQISGVDENDCDRTSRVSWLILEAAHMLNTSANITVRVHENVDPAFLRAAVGYLFSDRNGWPRFCGDTGLVEGYMKNGASKKDARNRIAVGCNWMAVPGDEFPMHDCIKINVAKVFEVALDDMMREGERSTRRLMEIYEGHLAKAVETVARGVELHLAHIHEMNPELIINLMMRGTLENGVDCSLNPRLRTVGLDGAGLAVAADSFAAIEQRIEIEKRLDWDQLKALLDTNFEGNERMRRMLLASERYCQGASLGDKWARRITDVFSELVHNQEVAGGRRLVPGWFSWSNTIMFGQQVGATPNGRLAGTPISHGANPNPGFRKDGAVTAQARGIALAQPGYGAAAPLQLEFDPKMGAEEGGIDRVLEILLAHFRMGGTLVNINVLDGEKLRKANENPDLYPDLVVRVTGFTAYFVSLSPEFRQLVMDRFLEGI